MRTRVMRVERLRPQATVKGAIHSVKNPRSGFIKADSIGEVIIDKNIKQPGNCIIE